MAVAKGQFSRLVTAPVRTCGTPVERGRVLPQALTLPSVPALLEGKRILVTGVLTDDSLAYGVAELAQREGAQAGADQLRPGALADQNGWPSTFPNRPKSSNWT